MIKVKKIKKWINRHIFYRVPASEFFNKTRNISNNIPPENMSDGINRNYRRMNDVDYANKMLRRKLGAENKYDKAESKLEDIANHIIYYIYNYPYKYLAFLEKETTIVNVLKEMHDTLNVYANTKQKINWKERTGYSQHLDYAFEDNEINLMKEYISYLKNKENEEILRKAIAMDASVLDKVEAAMKRIETISEIHEDLIKDRMIFNGLIRN